MDNVAIVRYSSVEDVVVIFFSDPEYSFLDSEYPVDENDRVSVEVFRRLRDLQDNHGYQIEIY